MRPIREENPAEPVLAEVLPFERPGAAVRYEYDIAVSFSGRQRSYVHETVLAARQLGLRVFYDEDVNGDWWGRNILVEMRRVYRTGTRFVVPFISEDYLASRFGMDELWFATSTALHRPGPYILPVVFGDIELPADVLHPYTVYLDAGKHAPHEIAAHMSRMAGAGE
ncbi:TIR domain-containing protein [Amycolatopsis vancoresmycina]|uniref:TIR domain-containing protein n=1 Tax=Amycolatopsis vancoresmycina DSM 44592 TaxID=1292037 RepID=R1HSY2_9PSEU|nr:TIR domain-containing protein [Amycolatopsis vancoresmycina]EOD66685.1 hypothetical protein H480_20334 [Amycolatopsis vancoresmycina DSM 44592]